MFRTPSLFLASIFAIIAVPPALAQSSTKPIDPVGTYDLDLERDGQVTGTVLTITKDKAGKLFGSIELHGQVMSFQVSVEDQTITLQSLETELTFTLTVKNDSTLSGNWSGGMGTGGIQGVRRKS
jgi:hypothetical protein